VPAAGGLVIASDQDSARAYAALVREISGEKVTLVLSDENGASKRIQKFAEGDSRWMVAVRMVSEGVDVPRLAVGVYATNTTTPLVVAQAVGRFVRARARGETASIFLPSVPHLLELAADLEVQRDHALGRPINNEGDLFAAEEDLLAQAQAGETASAELEQGPFQALGSDAVFDRVLYDGGEFGHGGEVQVGSDEEMDFLGIPGLLEPEQVRDLLHHRQSERARTRSVADEPKPVATHERLTLLRRELNGLVAAWNHRTGQPHGVTHNALRKECGGPPAAVASADQLQHRIDTLRAWAAKA
jgi:hypothetical protein